MSEKKSWVRPAEFADIPELQRVICNIYLAEHPDLARVMWFAPPGTRAQLTVRLLLAGLAALNGDPLADPQALSPSPSSRRRHRSRLVSDPPSRSSAVRHPTPPPAPRPPDVAPATSPSTPAAHPHDSPSPVPAELAGPTKSADEPPTSLPQFQVPAESLYADDEPAEDPPVSGGLALLRSFRSG
jgi:hypothetical protein